MLTCVVDRGKRVGDVLVGEGKGEVWRGLGDVLKDGGASDTREEKSLGIKSLGLEVGQ